MSTSRPWYFQLQWQIAIAMALAIPFGLIFKTAGAEAVGWMGDLFLRLLKMVVVPLILFSIVSGVTGVGSIKVVGNLGWKTVVYYLSTSALAVLVGLVMANVIHPGDPGLLDLASRPAHVTGQAPSLMELVYRLIPENPVEAMVYSAEDPHRGPNFLGLIFFSLFFGVCILALPREKRSRISSLFETLFAVMMTMTNMVIMTAPLGVFALLAKVVGTTGLSAFSALGAYMLTVFAALVIHGLITLPLLCRFLAGRSPWRYMRALSPALATAFSAASSNAALPLTLDSVERRAGISNRTASFVLPLGATINMDGTALYECVAVMFIAQCYGVDLSFVQQLLIMLTALLASIGAAGIPHSGLVMMGIVLGAVGLPLEGVGMILAVDRILDMCRTTVNVFSDAVGAAVVARMSGEPVVWPTQEAGSEP